jgi:hypothetical protein
MGVVGIPATLPGVDVAGPARKGRSWRADALSGERVGLLKSAYMLRETAVGVITEGC